MEKQDSSQPPDDGSSASPVRHKPFLNPATAPVPTKIAATPPPMPPPPPLHVNPAQQGVPATNAGPAAAGNGVPPAPANPVESAPAATRPATPLPPPPGAGAKAKGFYDQLFPVDSPRRKFGLVVVAALVITVLLLAKCAVSSVGEKIAVASKARAEETKARTTGVLLVKSNRPEATIEATRRVPAGEPAADPVKGPLGSALSGLPPGKYAVTLRAEGWPDAHGEAELTAGQPTELLLNFKSGSLRLDSVPTGATVKLGAATLGKTPLVIPLLPPGESMLSLQFATWPATTYKATITENQEATATVRLPHGRLVVDSVPAGATVVLEGKAYNQTPLFFDPLPAGLKKLTLQSKDLPPLEVSVTVVDGEEVKIRPVLGAVFPVLDPAELLRMVWIPDNPTTRVFNSTTGPFRPRNGVIKNIHRDVLYTDWQRKIFRYSGAIKSYDPASGKVEFAEQKSELARYRVVAQVTPVANASKADQLKSGTLSLFGRLTAVEEPSWPARVITIELTDAEILPEGTP